MKLPPITVVGLSAVCLMWAGGTSAVCAEAVIRIQGSPVVSPVLKSAAPALRAAGIEIKILEDAGSSQVAAALGAGDIDVALTTRSLTAEERAAFPERQMEEFQLGTQVVAFIVSRAVWENGVRALTREQVTNIYESRVLNWNQLGGEDRAIKFFDVAHGRGVWELFAGWVYGEARKAPAVKWEVVNEWADAKTSVYFNSGGASIVPLRYADGKEVMALAISDESGSPVEPKPAEIAAGKYPLSRPIFAVVGDKPTRNIKKLRDFLLSEKGQALVAASDLVPVGAKKVP